MERIIPTGRKIIQINTPRCCFDYELMCILLNKERVMQRDSDLLYFNSLIKNEWAIPCTADKSVCGPLCLNDGEEAWLWKEAYFDNEYFILNLENINCDIESILFIIMDYEWLFDKKIVHKDGYWSNFSVAVFYSDNPNDVLGKMTVLEKQPLFIDYPINSFDQCFIQKPHCYLCALQKNHNVWKYTPLWEGFSDIEKELQQFML